MKDAIKGFRKDLAFLVILSITLAPLLCFAASDPASAYPEKEIKVIVAYNAGGSNDLLSRKIADIIGKNKFLPKPVLTVNMGGGNTAQGINTVLQSKADGYTFLFHHTAFITVEAVGKLDVSYKDFDPVCGVMDMNFMLLALGDDNRWNNAQEFFKDAKKNPGKYSIGISGFAGPGHFALMQMLKAYGATGTLKEIPFASGGETLAAHMGRHTDVRMANTDEGGRYVKSGGVKILGVMSNNKLSAFPDAMTLKDAGLSADDFAMRQGYFAPKGTPKSIISKFAEAVKKAVETEEYKNHALNIFSLGIYRNAEAFRKVYDVDEVNIKMLAKTLKK